MKQLSLLLVMISMVCFAWATIDEHYEFFATTGTYTPITGTNAGISSDDVLSDIIPIGFTFSYGDFSYSEVKISSNGWIGLGTSQTYSNLSNSLNSTTYQPVVAPLWDDLSMVSGTVSYLMSGTAPNRVFIIQYENAKWYYSGPVGFNFQVQLFETGKISFIYGSNPGIPNNPSASIGINMSPGGVGWFYSVNPTDGSASTTIETSNISTFPNQGTVFEFNPVIPQPNDLAAIAISGNITPSVGLTANYTITIRNRGTNPQSTYQVQLIDSNGTELGSVNGATIQPNQNLDFQVSWIPSVGGPLVIRGKVILAGDQNPNNDLSYPINIYIQPEGVQAVTIADGTETMRIPMDFYFRNSLSETIYLSDELGFVSGTITALAFYNNFSESPANGATKIWLGSTNVQNLSGGWIPSTQMTLVFDGNITYPMGANLITIPLQTPYMHTPGNLVMMVQRPMDTTWYSYTDYFYGMTMGSNRTLNIFSDGTAYDPANPPGGTTPINQVPKITIFYTGQLIENDLGCLSITGNTIPTVGISSDYVITVKNNGIAAQTNYSIKLMKEGGIELVSVPGPTINSLQTLSVTVSWTPTQAGSTYVYGQVVLTGDEFATNNQTAPLNINVQPEGVQAVTIADGTETFRIPMDFFYCTSLCEVLYYADELGFVSGTITSLALYNNFSGTPANGATKIWLGSTNVQDLSGGWIPSTQLTLVFDGIVNYPSGTNTIIIPLQMPYMHTPGNLVMMVQRPMDTTWYSSTDNFYGMTMGSNRTLNIFNDGTAYDPANPPGGTTPINQVPKITIFYTGQLIENDLGCLSITGNTVPSVDTSSDYNITIKNNGIEAQTNYTVKLMKEGGIELASVPGPTINSLQTLSVTVSWIPTQTGPTYIYGQVILTGDEIAINNQTAPLNVEVMQAGLTVIQIGQGTATNSTTGSPTPYGTWYKNFRQQYLYTADDLYAAGAAPGLISALAFNVTSVNNCSPMPNYTIKLKHTDQAQLSTIFEEGEYTTVWVNDNFVPLAGWNVHTFTSPFFWNGASNLLIDICTDLIPGNYTENASVTYTPTTDPTCLRYQSDSSPASSATTGSTSVNRANARLFMTISDMGSLTGVVSSGGNLLSNATVTIIGTVFQTVTSGDGSYYFQYVPIGTQQAMATKHGYNEVTHTVTIVEDQTTNQNFELSLLPQVTVTGRIVGSDNLSVGLANASISLTGYEPYSATTNNSGFFTIPSVYAEHTYEYTVTATGYQPTTGQIIVGSVNVDVGDIMISELTLPPVNVQATDNGAIVSVTWEVPGTVEGGWIHYDSGQNSNSIGTGSANDFDVCIRFPASALSQYSGMSLYALKVWPAQAGTFSVRVWTGGTATQPANMIVDQGFTPVLASYNTVILNNPVLVTGIEELWFGYRNVVTGGYPAGCDAGPAVDGFGNMIYIDNSWSNLLSLNPDLDYNWNIQGYVGWSAPTTFPTLESIKTVLQATVPLPQSTVKPISSKLRTAHSTSDNFGSTKSISQNSKTVKSVSKTLRTTNPIRSNNNRIPLGYQVWRLLQGQENNENAWVLLTSNPINVLLYADSLWTSLPDGTYRWAVKTVYTNGVYSIAAFSNALTLTHEIGTIAGLVRNLQNQPVAGATITCGTSTASTTSSGAYSMSVLSGIYNVTASHPNYQSVTHPGIFVISNQTTTVNFQLPPLALPYNDSFETYPDFAISFSPWTLVDVDQSTTYGIQDYNWEHSFEPQAYIIFNPSATTPPLIDLTAHSGNKMACCFAAVTPPNNDWLITPLFSGVTSVKFWARSYTADFGLERFKVGISSNPNPNSFVIISGSNYIQAPVDWTEYNFHIAQPGALYIGIQCVSNDAIIFCVDDVIISSEDIGELEVPVVATALHNNYPNPFNPVTTIAYDVKEKEQVAIEIFNIKGQLVKTLVKGIQEPGNHTVVWDGNDNRGCPVSSGVYYYKMKAGKYNSTKKMIMIK